MPFSLGKGKTHPVTTPATSPQGDFDMLVNIPDGCRIARVPYNRMYNAVLRGVVRGERVGARWLVESDDCARLARDSARVDAARLARDSAGVDAAA